mgnify:CR=1 FL=1
MSRNPAVILADTNGDEKGTPANALTAGGIDTASWAPAPFNFDLAEGGPLIRNADGALVARANVLTDATSFRDDFSGSSLDRTLTGTLTFTNGSTIVGGSGTAFLSEIDRWDYIRRSTHGAELGVLVANVIDDVTLELAEPYAGATATGAGSASWWLREIAGSGTATVSAGSLIVGVGTDSGARAKVMRLGDYPPYVVGFRLAMAQRQNGQAFHVGLANDAENKSAFVSFEGTDPTQVKFTTRWDDGADNFQASTVPLPGGLLTSAALYYRIEIAGDKASLFVENVLVADHYFHVPGPYDGMNLHADVENLSSVSVANSIAIDFVYLTNFDRVEVAVSTKGDPLPIRIAEDSHTITSVLTTTSTAANQIALTYTVPTGKSFWIAGYSVSKSDSNARGAPVKIGRGALTETSPPGSVDGEVFRAFNVPSSGDAVITQDFAAMPRRLASGGDIVHVAITPTSSQTTQWRVSIDFVLR